VADVFLYLERGTVLHRLDPRAKLGALIGIFIMPFCFNHPLYVLVLLLAVIALTCWARALPNLWRVFPLLLLLFVFSSAMWSLFARGETILLRLGPLAISRESLLYGLAMGTRLVTMVLAGVVFLSTTMVEEFSWALWRFGLPFGASFALSTAFRLVPTFLGSGATVAKAQKSRGLELDRGNIFRRIARHGPLLVPIFVSAIRKTDLLAMALESKGFGSRRRRATYLQSSVGLREILALAAVAAALALCLALRLTGHGIILARM
jgi:energy-coupling factor transport system permease protein